MSKMYLRVNDDWIQLFSPGENTRFLVDTSGYGVDIIISDEPLVIFNKNDAYTLGGTIPQMRIDANKYIYAKGHTTDSTLIIADNEKIIGDDVATVQKEIDKLSAQVMKLSTRVSENRKDINHHSVDYKLLMRSYIKNILGIHTTESVLSKRIIEDNARLLTLENNFLKHVQSYRNLYHYVNTLKSSSITGERISDIEADVRSALTSLTNLTNRVNILDPSTSEDADANTKALIKQITDPLDARLKDVTNDFTLLNNALVRLSANSDIKGIEDTFVKILEDTPSDMNDVVTALKNNILGLVQATKINDEQASSIKDINDTDKTQQSAIETNASNIKTNATSLQTKVDYKDNVKVGMSMSDLVDALGLKDESVLNK